MRIAFAITAAVFTLAACGGGGSSGKPVSMMDPPPAPETPPERTPRRIAFAPGADGPYSTAGLPAPLAADVQHMPIYRDDSRILAGVDQTAAPLVHVEKCTGHRAH